MAPVLNCHPGSLNVFALKLRRASTYFPDQATPLLTFRRNTHAHARSQHPTRSRPSSSASHANSQSPTTATRSA